MHYLFLDPDGHSISSSERDPSIAMSKGKKDAQEKFYEEYKNQIKEEELARMEAELEWQEQLKLDSSQRSDMDASLSEQKRFDDSDYTVSVIRVKDIFHKRQLYCSLDIVDQGEEWYTLKAPSKPKTTSVQKKWEGDALVSQFCDKEGEFATGSPWLIPKSDFTEAQILRVCVWGTQLLKSSVFLGFGTLQRPTVDSVQRTIHLTDWMGETKPGTVQVMILLFIPIFHSIRLLQRIIIIFLLESVFLQSFG